MPTRKIISRVHEMQAAMSQSVLGGRGACVRACSLHGRAGGWRARKETARTLSVASQLTSSLRVAVRYMLVSENHWLGCPAR